VAGLTLDASTPAITTNTVGTVAALASGSFTPPVGAVIVVLWSGDALTTPAAPTITDSLGTHIIWVRTDWQSQADAPGSNGQAAAWIGVVITSTSMTITVTSGSVSGERTAALAPRVYTGADTVNPLGAHGKSGSLGATSIAQAYTALATNGLGLLSNCDFAAVGVETAGTGTTRIGSALVGSNFDYGFFQRTNPDDVAGVSNTINVTIPGTGVLNWVYLELNPAAEGGAQLRRRVRQTSPIWHPGMPRYLRPKRRFVETVAGGTTWDPGEQTDSAGLTDTVTLEQDKALTDPAGLTDPTVLEQDKVLTDPAGLTDPVALTQSKVLTDAAGLTDDTTIQLLKTVNQTDLAGLTDTLVLEQDKVLTDLAGLTDNTAITQSKVVTDSAGLTDDTTMVLAKVVNQDDPAGLTDTLAITQAKVLTDVAGLTDPTSITQQKVVTDSVGLIDTFTAQLVKDVAATDSAGLTDSITIVVAYSRPQTDDAGLTDTVLVDFQPVVVPYTAMRSHMDLDLDTQTTLVGAQGAAGTGTEGQATQGGAMEGTTAGGVGHEGTGTGRGNMA
jgi:hypothetical protein